MIKTELPSSIIFSFILLIALSTFAQGTYISLSTQITTENLVFSNETYVAIKLTNLGDEAAHDVQLSLLFSRANKKLFDSTILSPGPLFPNSPYEGNITIKLKNPDNIKPGAYSFALLTIYKDANGYPFSSVSPISISIRQKTFTQATGMLKKVKLPSYRESGEGEERTMTLNLRNLDTKPRKFKINLFIPRELKTINFNEREVELEGSSEKDIKFKVESFGALPGSTYPVFATIEYADIESNLHYSNIASGIIEIVEKEDGVLLLPNLSGSLPIITLFILIILFVLYQFKGKRTAEEGRKEIE